MGDNDSKQNKIKNEPKKAWKIKYISTIQIDGNIDAINLAFASYIGIFPYGFSLFSSPLDLHTNNSNVVFAHNQTGDKIPTKNWIKSQNIPFWLSFAYIIIIFVVRVILFVTKNTKICFCLFCVFYVSACSVKLVLTISWNSKVQAVFFRPNKIFTNLYSTIMVNGWIWYYSCI